MEISVNSRSGYNIVIKADNVHIEEDIESRAYNSKLPDGKTDFSKCERDIDTGNLDQFSSVLNDMIHYRKKEYDSKDLISSLFEKLPDLTRRKLLEDLIEDYA